MHCAGNGDNVVKDVVVIEALPPLLIGTRIEQLCPAYTRLSVPLKSGHPGRLPASFKMRARFHVADQTRRNSRHSSLRSAVIMMAADSIEDCKPSFGPHLQKFERQ